MRAHWLWARATTDAADRGALAGTLLTYAWSFNNGLKYLDLPALMTHLPGFQPDREALFVVGSSNLSRGDRAVYEHLRWALGYDVVVKSDAAVRTADASGKDVVIVSSSTDSGLVTTKFKYVAVPVMTWEPFLFDDMAMVYSGSSNYGTATGQTTVRLQNSSHPLAVGLDQGNSSVYDAPNTLSWGKPAASAIKIATLSYDSSKAVIFGYDQGDWMVGMKAPARRVGFMLNDDGLGDLWTQRWYFDAAVTWLVTGN